MTEFVGGIGINELKGVFVDIAATRIKETADYFSLLAVTNPLVFEAWKFINHRGSSVVFGLIGTSFLKMISDSRFTEGRSGLSNTNVVLLTTGVYTMLEWLNYLAGKELGYNISFDMGDVMVTAATSAATVLLDNLIKSRITEGQIA